MAGHNKWSTIKNKKGKEDKKKAKIFSKLTRQIIVAVREGGDDPEYNSSLKTAIDQAKAENMPNDNISRAISRGSGGTEGENYDAILYEGYGPGGVAILVESLTDNRNRTASNLRHYFDKYGGNLGQDGSVAFQFTHHGLISIDEAGLDEEGFMLEAIEVGANDVYKEDGKFWLDLDISSLNLAEEALRDLGYNILSKELVYSPNIIIEDINVDQEQQLMTLFEILSDDDDVQDIYHNWAGANDGI